MKLLIFGDSYSTYEGYIPQGYEPYYPGNGDGTVDDVSKTWWHMYAAETSAEIVLNNSWSGTTICNTGYSGDCSQKNSFIYRLSKMIEEGFFDKHTIDRVLVFGGTNDSWTGNECGRVMFSDWSHSDLFYILPGISYFMNKLQSVISKEKIHFVINTDLREEVKSGIVEICKHFGISYTELCDIDKQGGHPTQKGMTQIKDQVLETFK